MIRASDLFSGDGRRRLLRALIVLAGMTAAGLLLSGSGSNAAVMVPFPVYDIETWSGPTHLHHTGVFGAPALVDVDGQFGADIDVLVSPANVSMILQGINPTLSIVRDPVAVATSKPSPPLKVKAKFTLVDLTNSSNTQTISFGYETGAGGSIPPHFNASLGGLLDAFNPLAATVDTITGLSGITTSLNAKPTYIGPLTLLLDTAAPGSSTTEMSFAYQPFPGKVKVTYATDNAGSHITYKQDPDAVTHVRANVTSTAPNGDLLTVNGDIDPLPAQFTTDFKTTPTSGTVKFTQVPAGRNPDIGFDVTNVPTSGEPLVARGAITALPKTVQATWSTATNAPAGTFDAPDGPVGAVDLTVHNFLGAPTVLDPFAPSQRAFVNYQSEPAGAGTEQEIAAHLDLVRHLDFHKSADGFDVFAIVGDGQAPLQVRFRNDGRTDPEGSLIDADATVSPLPLSTALSLHAPDPSQPVHVVADTSAAANITGHAFVTPTGGGETCGATRTMCADFTVTDFPNHLDMLAGPIDEFGRGVDIDDTTAPGHSTDVTADVTLGPGAIEGLSVNEANPLFGHIVLTDIPRHVRSRIHNASDGNLDLAEFHACDWDFGASTPKCETPNQAGALGSVEFSANNFPGGVRPADIAPVRTSAPQYLTVVARQPSADIAPVFEATGRIPNVKQVALRQTGGILGVNTALGNGNEPLQAHVDLDLAESLMKADAVLDPVPTSASFCMRKADATPGTEVGVDYTEDCEENNPFDESPTPDQPPMSAAFHTTPDTSFHITADATMIDKTATDDLVPGFITNQVHVDTDVPTSVVAHVRMNNSCEGSDCLPTRIAYQTPPGADPTTAKFRAERRVGDAACGDPRNDKLSLCLGATLHNLPSSATVCYDPNELGVCDDDDEEINLVVHKSADPDPFNITALDLSSVTPVKPQFPTPQHPWDDPKIVVVTDGKLLDVPETIKGHIGINDFSLTATPPIGTVGATYKNFIGPAVMDGLALPSNRAGVPAPDDTVAAFIRGTRMQVTATVHDVKNVTYAPAVNASGQPLNDQTASWSFDPGATVRVYLDSISNDGNQAIADMTLQRNPQSASMCMRAPDADAADAVAPVWCDTHPDPDDADPAKVGSDPASVGAFQFTHVPSGLIGPSVDAYFRQSSASTGSIVAGTMAVAGIPRTLQGTFSSTGVDIGGFDTDGDPQGIRTVGFNIGSFDPTDAQLGYGASAPHVDHRKDLAGTLPSVDPALLNNPGFGNTNAVAFHANDSDFRVSGTIGLFGTPSSHVQRVALGTASCAKPDEDRDDYPFYPTFDRPDAQYTCIRADFDKDAGAGATPLGLSAHLDQDGQLTKLTGGGVTDLPPWFQATIASSRLFHPQTSAPLPRCGAEGGDQPDSNQQCMPPLFRYDQPELDTPPVLFGTVGRAPRDHYDNYINALSGVTPDIAFSGAPNFGLDPQDDWSAGATGAWVKVGNDAESEQSGMLVGLRLGVPGSLTLDQIRTYDVNTNYFIDNVEFGVHDLDAHFVERQYPDSHPHGQIVDALGDVQALVQKWDNLVASPNDKGGQFLLQNDPSTPIPGEVGINMYNRVGGPGMGPILTSNLTQLDVRLSSPLSLIAHFTNMSEDLDKVNATITDIPAVPDDTPPDYVCNVTGSCDPGARFRIQTVAGFSSLDDVIGHFQTCAQGGGCDHGADSKTTHIDHIDVNLDLMPPGAAAAARRLDAVVHADEENGTTGIEIAAFASPDTSDSTPAKYMGNAEMYIDHLHITDQKSEQDAPDPVSRITSHLWLYAKLTLNLSFGEVENNGALGVERFVMHEAGFHFVVSSFGGTSALGPVVMTVDDGSVHFTVEDFDVDDDMGLLLNITEAGDPTAAFAAIYIIEQGGALQFGMSSCVYALDEDEGWYTAAGLPAGPFDTNTITTTIDNGTVDFALNPFMDSRRGYFSTAFSPGIDELQSTITAALCSAFDADQNLRSNGPLVNLGDAYPADPISQDQHPVPGTGDSSFGVYDLGLHVPEFTGGKVPPTPFEDNEAPLTDTFFIPAGVEKPDQYVPGETHLHFTEQPTAVLLSADNPGGSGVDPATISYDIDFQDHDYTGPFVIPPGEHTICSEAFDFEQNLPQVGNCQTIFVDDLPPTISINAPPPTGSNGWYTAPFNVVVARSDVNSDGTSGSGIDETYWSLDDAPFTLLPFPVTIPSGIHRLRVFATDDEGQVSEIKEANFKVQTTKPTIGMRLTAPEPARNGWWRSLPLFYATAYDPPGTAGVESVQYRIDNGPWLTYGGPVTMPAGIHTVQVQALDRSGAVNNALSDVLTVPVDIGVPTAVATKANPGVGISLLNQTKLGWKAGDDLSHQVHVDVLVLNAAGDLVRKLDGGNVNVTPGGSLTTGFTEWDGKDSTLTGLIPLGVYSFRVLVTDEAGNTAQSADSAPFTVATGFLVGNQLVLKLQLLGISVTVVVST